MKIKFKKAAKRDKAMAEFIGSDEFLDIMRGAIEAQMVDKNHGHAYVFPVYKVRTQDMPYVEKQLDVLKGEYLQLQLDHVRRNVGLVEEAGVFLTLGMGSAWKDQLIIDTKPATKPRRLMTGMGY